ncbi:hypothetical protein [Agromyces sp. SYSU T0242]|uniref:hypothetical protein n=1 Tax=Agromyces litoreus TaxID=3158561 RepID=UPI0033976804
MPIISFSLPMWDGRGDRLANYEISTFRNRPALFVSCPPWIASQIDAMLGADCERCELPRSFADEFTDGWLFDVEIPDGLEDALEMLSTVLSIPAPDHVDVAITLDLYNRPDDDGDLQRTTPGYWIWTTKHATEPTWSNSRNSRRLMIAALVRVIIEHPLLANATAIVTAPGHEADGNSFAEVLAREVASRVGIPFVETTSPGPRPPQKESPQDLTNEFTVQGELSGDVIVLDDVYHTGGSASGAAAAARRAGAERVFSLTVARTIRW